MSEKYKLRWEKFPANVVTSFKDLRDENDFHDVTLLTEDLEHISAHKVVLSACSPYFKAILKKCKERNPLICLDGIAKRDLQCILDFVYLGKVQFEEEYLHKFLQIAKKLKLKGVSEWESKKDSNSFDVENMPSDDTGVIKEPKQELKTGKPYTIFPVNKNLKVKSEMANDGKELSPRNILRTQKSSNQPDKQINEEKHLKEKTQERQIFKYGFVGVNMRVTERPSMFKTPQKRIFKCTWCNYESDRNYNVQTHEDKHCKVRRSQDLHFVEGKE